MTSRGLPAAIAVAVFGLASACNGTGTGSTSGSETGGTTGAITPISITATRGLQFNAGFSGSYGPIALAAAGGEGELFFSEAGDAGSTYILQHLSPAGKADGAGVEIAKGTPTAPPKLAVSSNGKEVACCWEDWGHLDPAAGTAGQVTRCNSVPVTGVATDDAMDGGFGDVGSDPVIAPGASSTALVYAQAGDVYISEALLFQSVQNPATFTAPYPPAELNIVPLGTGFTMFISDGGAIAFSEQAHNLYSDGGLQPVPGGAAAGSFAAATNTTPKLPAVTAVLFHQGSNVATTLLGTATPATVTVSSATEQPLEALAATACNSNAFGFAYALDGGDVGLREVNTDGALVGTGTLSPAFGTDITSIALAAVDGGLLIAAANFDNVAVYLAPCP